MMTNLSFSLKTIFKRTLGVALWLVIFSISANAQALQLKIASYNMQQPFGTNWDGRKGTIVNVLNAQNCDIVGTQELYGYMRDYLLSNTSGYVSYGSGRDGGDAGEASFIFYKTAKYTLDAANSGNFWLSNTPNTPSRFGGDYNRICSYVHLIEKSSGQGFYIFNIHNYMPAEASFRLAAAKMLAGRVNSRTVNDPVWVTGDFNSSEGDAVTIWMKSGSDNPLRFRDTYRDYDPNGTITTGFGTKFDYIYCPNSSFYTTSNSYAIDPSGSDHLPLIAFVAYNANTVNAQISLSQSAAINEGAENGKTITVTLTNDQFKSSLNAANWTLANLPAGVSKGAVTRVSATQATIALVGNATVGTYTNNIKDVTVTVAAAELVSSSSAVSKNSGIILTKAPQKIPGKIESESYNDMSGIQLETTSDAGGGQNMGYLGANDWITYSVSVTGTKTYKLDTRNASLNSNGQIKLQVDGVDVKTLNFTATGGWQTWTTTSTNIDLTQGLHEIKLVVVVGDVNINWFNFSETTSPPTQTDFKVLTQNLWRRNTSWTTRRNNVLNMINDQKPDIISITEGDEGKSPEMAGLLPAYTLETGPWNEESTCLLYNKSTMKVIETGVFGYSSTPDQNRTSDWGDGAVNNWLRKCNWALFEQISTGKRFYVYNNHLDALNSPLGPAYWRLEQAKLMAARIAARTYPQYPFVVIGDLNEAENGSAISYLKNGAANPVQMKDTYREILPSGDGYTFGTIKLDYIMTEKTTTLNTKDANIVYPSQYGQLSDHNAIWAVFSFSEPVVDNDLFANYDGKDLSFTGFGGTSFAKIANPVKGGINTSNNVGQAIKTNGSETWAGIFSATVPSKINFSTKESISMKVYSPVIGKVLLKLEDGANNLVFKEVEVTNTQTNQWEELVFNFAGTASNTYNKITLFFDFGKTVGNTFYFDDLQLKAGIPPCSITSSITPGGSLSICQGNAITLSANTGTGFTYKWSKDGLVVNTVSSFVSVNTAGIYTVEVSNANGCKATSSPVTVTVNPNISASVSIAASATTVCSGTGVTFTATGTNIGSNPVFTWFRNGISQTTGATFNTIPANGEIIRAVAVAGGTLPTCLSNSSATSNGINLTVNPNVSASVSIAASAPTVCSGTGVSFTATGTNIGSNPVFTWFRNGVSQTTGTTFNTIPSNGDLVRAVVVAGGILPTCLTNPSATSSGINLTVNPNVSAFVSIAASATNVCSNTGVTFTATGLNAGNNPSFNWMRNNVLVFNGSTFTYTPSQGDVIRAVLTTGGTLPACLTNNSATSSGIMMSVSNSITPSVAISSSAITVCAGTTVLLTSTTSGTGSAPNFTWFKNGIAQAGNANSFSFIPAQNDQIRLALTAGGSGISCISTASVTSSGVAFVVNNFPAVPSVISPVSYCQESVAAPLSASGFNLVWYSSSVGGVGSSMAITPSTTLAGNQTYFVASTNQGCESAREKIEVNITPSIVSAVRIMASATTVCSGTGISITATSTNGGTNPTITWFKNGQSQVSGQTFTFVPAHNDQITATMTIGGTVPACVSLAPTNSNVVTIVVNAIGSGACPLPTPSSISGPAFVIVGSNQIIYSVSSVPGNGYTWTVPIGFDIVAGQGTNQITINVGSNPTSGNITLTQSNTNGNSTVSLPVTSGIAPVVSVIQGPSIVLPSQSGVVYSVTSVAGISYSWTVPSGATIISGQGSNEIMVDFGTSVSGTILLTATNEFGVASTSISVATSPLTTWDGTTAGQLVQVSPNPFSEYTQIRSTIDFQYVIFDLSGNEVEKGNAKGGQTLGNTLPAGSYIMKCDGEMGMLLVKLIKY